LDFVTFAAIALVVLAFHHVSLTSLSPAQITQQMILFHCEILHDRVILPFHVDLRVLLGIRFFQVLALTCKKPADATRKLLSLRRWAFMQIVPRFLQLYFL